jgi:membrane protease subunit (stomatin/prohibitin family)
MMNVAGNAEVYRKELLVEQMRSEVVGAFQNILNSLSEPEHKIEALSLPSKTDEIKEIMSQQNFDGPIQNRGVGLISFVVESVTLTDESKEQIRKYELGGDQFQQQGALTGAYAEAVQNAASNPNGSMNGFIGMGMMNMASGNVFGQNTAAVANNTNYAQPNAAAFVAGQTPTAPQGGAPVPPPAPQANTWKCPSCGTENTGKFCMECGKPMPAPATPKMVKCPKCGKEWPAGTKFCGECGEKL